MTESAWHAPADLIDRFGADPASLDGVSAASLEAHLLVCDECRAAVNTRTPPEFLEHSWNAVAARIDQPRLSVVERVLCRLGVSEGSARLLGATPGLSLAALAAVVVIAAGAVAASRATDTAGAFLILAPILPLIAVACTFVSAADPAGETGVATPLHGLGLVLRRSAIVLAIAFFVLGLADLALGQLGVPVLAWVLPALALSVGMMALSTWFRVEASALGLGLGWLAVVAIPRWVEGRRAPYADAVVFGSAGQIAAAFVLAIAIGVVLIRRERFQTMEVIG